MEVQKTYELIVIGAGPAGISMAAEARHAGILAQGILVLEKAEEHSWTIRKLYPERKLVTANYKGQDAVCHGVMCIPDMSKEETLTLLDRVIGELGLAVNYKEQVFAIRRKADGMFAVTTERASYETRVCVIAIGIFGRPHKPDYQLPRSLMKRVHFDVTTANIEGSTVLVVGGGDSASEYGQFLVERGNRVALSYRQSEFLRMNDINRDSLLALEACGSVEVLRSSNVLALEDVEGRPMVKFEEERYGERVFDHVVYALGGTTPQNFLRTVGIKFDGETPAFKSGYETSIPGLFLVGDLSSGRKGGSIIAAFNSSHAAMRLVCEKYLTCPMPPA